MNATMAAGEVEEGVDFARSANTIFRFTFTSVGGVVFSCADDVDSIV
jgi:hypothetical protein